MREEYETVRQQHVAEFLQMIPAHMERLAWPSEQLKLERERRLRSLLDIAIAHSPWHRERLAGLDPATVVEEDLARIPPMTKDDLMSRFDECVTDRRVTLAEANAHIERLTEDAYLLDDLHAVASGGSSGRRGVFVYGREAWASAWAAFLRYLLRDRMTDPGMADAPMVLAGVGAERASHMTGALPQTFASPAMQAHRFPVTMPLADIVAGLNAAQPTYLAAYASALPDLVAEARAGRLRIRPRRIVSSSEPLLPEVRDAAQETWGAPVANWWGTSEAGPTGIGCFHGSGMHLADDLMIVEPVDEQGQPVPPGVRSAKVYLTVLYNPILPLIRYELTDEVTLLDEPCPCGSTHRRVADIAGRADDVFRYDGGLTVHPHVFRSPLSRDPHIAEYQVRQTRDGAEVLVRAAGDVDVDQLEKALVAEVERSGLVAPRIAVRVVERIARQESGKLRRFVPLSSGATI